MRNLKRALSLAVASVMLLGMMVVGSGAASYDDVTSEHNQEAIDVLQAVGVMTGDDQGNFNPDQLVTRGEMAVIMTQLLDLGIGSYGGVALPFTDVPDWAHAYVAAIYANGVTGGTSATTYGTDEPVTAVQAGLMMMKALGYFQYPGDFNDNWILATITQAARISLFDGLDVETEQALTRNEVAQLALNALEAGMVDFTGDLGMQVDMGNGQSVTVGYHSEYSYRTGSGGRYNALGDTVITGTSNYILQLGEDLYSGDLKRSTSSAYDGMERPATTWSYKSINIGTYGDAADRIVVVDKGQTAAEEVDDMSKSWNLVANSVYINGDQKGSAEPLLVGDVVEVYLSDSVSNQVDRLVVTRYSATQLTGDVTIRGTGDDREVRVPGIMGYTDVADVYGYEGLVEDDVVYYYEDNEGVTYLAKADYVEGTLTSINNKTPWTYVIGGTAYTPNGNMITGTNTIKGISSPVFNTQYRFYLDNNGYAVYGEELEDALSDYVVVQEIAYVPDGNAIGDDARVEARIVKMDGTTEVVTLDSIVIGTNAADTYVGIGSGSANEDVNSDGNRYLALSGGNKVNEYLTSNSVTKIVDKTFFTYKVNSDGEYELTYVNGDGIRMGSGSGKLEGGKVQIGGSSIAVNDSTVFVVAKESGKSTFNVYTGKNNVPDLEGATLSYVRESGVVTYVYIDTYTDKYSSGDYIYILDTKPIAYFEVKKDDGTTYGYNTYKAVVNGEYDEVMVSATSMNAPIAGVAVDLLTPTYNDDGVITKLAAGAAIDEPAAFGYKLEGTTLLTGKTGSDYANAYVCEDDALAFIMDEDGNVTETYVTDLRADDNDVIRVVLTNGTDNEVDFVFVEEKDADETGIVITASDKSLTAAGTYTETIDGNTETVIKYTVKNGANVTIAPEAGCTITTKNSSPYWSSMTSTLTYSSVSTGTWIAIKVVAEDTTVAYYAIEVIA